MTPVVGGGSWVGAPLDAAAVPLLLRLPRNLPKSRWLKLRFCFGFGAGGGVASAAASATRRRSVATAARSSAVVVVTATATTSGTAAGVLGGAEGGRAAAAGEAAAGEATGVEAGGGGVADGVLTQASASPSSRGGVCGVDGACSWWARRVSWGECRVVTAAGDVPPSPSVSSTCSTSAPAETAATIGVRLDWRAVRGGGSGAAAGAFCLGGGAGGVAAAPPWLCRGGGSGPERGGGEGPDRGGGVGGFAAGGDGSGAAAGGALPRRGGGAGGLSSAVGALSSLVARRGGGGGGGALSSCSSVGGGCGLVPVAPVPGLLVLLALPGVESLVSLLYRRRGGGAGGGETSKGFPQLGLPRGAAASTAESGGELGTRGSTFCAPPIDSPATCADTRYSRMWRGTAEATRQGTCPPLTWLDKMPLNNLPPAASVVGRLQPRGQTTWGT